MVYSLFFFILFFSDARFKLSRSEINKCVWIQSGLKHYNCEHLSPENPQLKFFKRMWGTSFYLTQTHTGGTSVLNADQIRGDFTHNTILLEVLEFVSSWWHSLHFELTLISFCEQWNVWISVAFRPAICTISNSRAVTCRVPSYYRERDAAVF